MIWIELNKRDFEYDIHSLVKAFFPEREVSIAGCDAETVELKISVFYEQKSIRIVFSDPAGNILREGSTEIDIGKDRKETKNALKHLLYGLLCDHTGHGLPWGNLTGIRPTKIPMALLDAGEDEEKAAEYMRKTYLVSREKAALAVDIAARERRLLQKLNYRNGYSLYVGIPFCPSICLYCSFSSSPIKLWQDKVEDYLEALFKEIDASAHLFREKELDTIYMGGGTPTTLSPSQMDRLLTKIETAFDLSHLKEFTVEAGRPDSITADKLRVLRDHGIGRISVNPQTMNQHTLDVIGRRHTVEETMQAFWLARELGFDNINMDLIIGLPGEGPDEVRHTMEVLEKMDPDSITVHSLALKRATRLNLMKDVYREISFTNSAQIMDMTAESCERSGLRPYYLYRQKNMAGNFENVGYAKEGKACLYNILIMEEVQSILALGAGASTKLVYARDRIERVENVKDIRSYIDRIDEMIDRKKKIEF